MKDNAPCMQKAYAEFLSAIADYKMEDRIKKGVLVGFSGGPDSVLLLHLLARYRESVYFPMLAVHVHHGIRGESASRDADFSARVCAELGIEFLLKHVDVPAFSVSHSLGTEEAARILRYSVFEDILQGRNDISAIVLGHNATDNLETVLFHLFRGCGTGGLGGIPPIRDNIIRPLIRLPKQDILAALQEARLPFVLDETNEDTAYTRNYIRHEILPRLSHISSAPEVSVQRVCRNLICDNDYIEKQAAACYRSIENKIASRQLLSEMHPAIFARVISRLGRESGSTLEQKHIDKLFSLIQSNNRRFSVDLPGSVHFRCEDDACRFEKQKTDLPKTEEVRIPVELNAPILLQNGMFLLSYGACQNISSNIYNFSIKANLRSAIIEGELFLRNKREGDSYYYGGMTRKLKKLFNDKKIPLQDRELLPILCDDKGIVWVPGFGVRDDGGCEENASDAAFFY